MVALGSARAALHSQLHLGGGGVVTAGGATTTGRFWSSTAAAAAECAAMHDHVIVVADVAMALHFVRALRADSRRPPAQVYAKPLPPAHEHPPLAYNRPMQSHAQRTHAIGLWAARNASLSSRNRTKFRHFREVLRRLQPGTPHDIFDTYLEMNTARFSAQNGSLLANAGGGGRRAGNGGARSAAAGSVRLATRVLRARVAHHV
jgi:hypothetical protein